MKNILITFVALILLCSVAFAQGGGPMQGNTGQGGLGGPYGGGTMLEVITLTFEPNVGEKIKEYVGKEIILDALLISISGQTNSRLRLETMSGEFVVIATSQEYTAFNGYVGKSVTVNARVAANGEMRFVGLLGDEDSKLKELVQLNQQQKIADVPKVEQKEFNFTELLLATAKDRPAQQQYNSVEEEIIAYTPIYAAKIREINTKVNEQDATNIARAILVASNANNVDARLLFALIQRESHFNKNIVSSAGAQGFGQLMPATAKSLGVTNSFDIAQNVNGAAKYLAEQLKAFDNDVTKALAAYNAGPSRVRAANGVPNIRETRNYVQLVLHEYNKLCGK